MSSRRISLNLLDSENFRDSLLTEISSEALKRRISSSWWVQLSNDGRDGRWPKRPPLHLCQANEPDWVICPKLGQPSMGPAGNPSRMGHHGATPRGRPPVVRKTGLTGQTMPKIFLKRFFPRDCSLLFTQCCLYWFVFCLLGLLHGCCYIFNVMAMFDLFGSTANHGVDRCAFGTVIWTLKFFGRKVYDSGELFMFVFPTDEHFSSKSV